MKRIMLLAAVATLPLIPVSKTLARPSSPSDSSAASRQDPTSQAVPGGTEIAVRTNEAIDSKTASEGKTYSAVIERDVVGENGTVVIPKGSNADLVVRKASNSDLALDLRSVTVGGKRYQVSSTDVERSAKNRQGIGKNKRTAEMVGGGAVLGTLLGAIAGGGKGAAIGAVAGGAAGGTAQVLTRGKEVRVPAESVLTFRLESPLRLEPAS